MTPATVRPSEAAQPSEARGSTRLEAQRKAVVCTADSRELEAQLEADAGTKKRLESLKESMRADAAARQSLVDVHKEHGLRGVKVAVGETDYALAVDAASGKVRERLGYDPLSPSSVPDRFRHLRDWGSGRTAGIAAAATLLGCAVLRLVGIDLDPTLALTLPTAAGGALSAMGFAVNAHLSRERMVAEQAVTAEAGVLQARRVADAAQLPERFVRHFPFTEKAYVAEPGNRAALLYLNEAMAEVERAPESLAARRTLAERALAVFGSDHPNAAVAVMHLAEHLPARGARAIMIRAIPTMAAIDPRHPVVRSGHELLARALRASEDMSDAEREWLSVCDRVLSEPPTEAPVQPGHAQMLDYADLMRVAADGQIESRAPAMPLRPGADGSKLREIVRAWWSDPVHFDRMS